MPLLPGLHLGHLHQDLLSGARQPFDALSLHAGGQLAQELTTVSLEAEATQLPSEVVVDLSSLQEGSTVLVKDLDLPRGAVVAGDPEALVLQITGVAVVAEETEGEAAEGEAAEAPAAE